MRLLSPKLLYSASNRGIATSFTGQSRAEQHVRFTGRDTNILYLEKSDHTAVPAEEDDFYRYTTKRWLSNDALEASKRYLKFNIGELLEAAEQSNPNHVRRCIRATKFQEGQYNKAFLLTFDDNSEVVAKLPNPNAGPKVFSTASEVATMEFARTVLGLPIPKVLSWNCVSSNPVESEYIFMEKAKGTPLGDAWFQLPYPSKRNVIEQVVELEKKLASLQFPAHGCVYYAKDLSTEYQCKESDSLPGDTSKKFCIGPLVESTLWENGRSEMRSSQGPWRGLVDYATSLGVNERAWARQFAKPQMNYFRSDDKPETPSKYLDLIEKYLFVAPYIAASQADIDDLLQPTLWHRDFHLNNIYIDLSTNKITDIIDWQGVSVAPLALQAGIPRMVRHSQQLPSGWVMPEKPADYELLDEKKKLKVDKSYESALCQKYYEIATAKRNPQHYSAITHNNSWKAPYIEPLKAISGAWSSQEVFRLRSCLMAVSEHWQELAPEVNECPIAFSEEERKLHSEEMENRGYVEELLEGFQENGILPADGLVDPEDYGLLQTINLEQRKLFMSLAENEDQKAWMEKIWPYQDDAEV